jgi:hypothetical protein
MLQSVSLAQASVTGHARRKAGMREMTTEAPQGAEQNPAYRPQSYFSSVTAGAAFVSGRALSRGPAESPRVEFRTPNSKHRTSNSEPSTGARSGKTHTDAHEKSDGVVDWDRLNGSNPMCPMLRKSILVFSVLPLVAVCAQQKAGRGPSAAAREAQALAETFRGITTNGSIQPGLFPLRSTGVSTGPVKNAAVAFLGTLTPEQRAKTKFPVDDPEWRKWMNIHRYSEPDAVFYYRIHSPVILIEFDHQRPANTRHLAKDPRQPIRDHIHAVVRTPNGNDYGQDLLRQHDEQVRH